MNDIDQLLGSFGLSIEHFRQKQDNPIYGFVHSIYQNIPATIVFFATKGYHINQILDIHASDDLIIEQTCKICLEVLDPRIRSGIQCMECFQYIGHLKCLQNNKETLTAKPCCGKPFIKPKGSSQGVKSTILSITMQKS